MRPLVSRLLCVAPLGKPRAHWAPHSKASARSWAEPEGVSDADSDRCLEPPKLGAWSAHDRGSLLSGRHRVSRIQSFGGAEDSSAAHNTGSHFARVVAKAARSSKRR